MDRIILGIILAAVIASIIRWIARSLRSPAGLARPACGACPLAAQCGANAARNKSSTSGSNGDSHEAH